MKEDTVSEHLRRLGLYEPGLHVDIYIDYASVVKTWDQSIYAYRYIGDKLLKRIMNSTEFDHDLFCLLRGTFALETKDALSICLK